MLVAALFPALAGFVVLRIADVSSNVWQIQAAAIALAFVVACLGRLARSTVPADRLAAVIVPLAMGSVAAPLLRGEPGPARWIAAGSMNVYVAPVVLPALLAVSTMLVQRRDHRETAALASMLGTAGLLALQPDASQALAFTAASAVVTLRGRAVTRRRRWLSLVAMAVLTAWAFSRPDPLRPVPHVEGVFALAFAHSILAGVSVATSAVVFVTMLVRRSLIDGRWMAAVAAYYAVLLACSLAGLTPAPLIGFGAGPVVGYGVLGAVSGSLREPAVEQDGPSLGP